MRARITSSKHKNLSKKKKKITNTGNSSVAKTTAEAKFQSAVSLLNEFLANSKPQALKKK